jgi:hypothetical protein
LIRAAKAWVSTNKLENYYLLITNAVVFDSSNDIDIDSAPEAISKYPRTAPSIGLLNFPVNVLILLAKV